MKHTSKEINEYNMEKFIIDERAFIEFMRLNFGEQPLIAKQCDVMEEAIKNLEKNI